MSIVRATPGEAISQQVRFTDEFDNPVLDIQGPVKFRVSAADGRDLVIATAIVDVVDPSIYVVNFTLPANTPVTSGSAKAKLVVVGSDASGSRYLHKEWFEVLAAGDDVSMSKARNIITTLTTGFMSQFIIPASLMPASVNFNVFGDNNSTLISNVIVPAGVVVGDNRVYTANIPAGHGLTPSNSIQGAYLAQWDASGGNLTSVEVDTSLLYVLNNASMLMLETLRSFLDKGVLQNIHPYLSWDAETFIHHLHKGFEYVNGTPPRITTFSIGAPLPVGLTHYIEKAAMLDALRAQYMAESQSSFNFQGLGVQLDVDRLPALSEMIGQLQTELDKLVDAKRAWIDSGSPTGPVIGNPSGLSSLAGGIVISEATNYASTGVWDEAIVPFGGFSNNAGRYRKRGSRL